MNEEIRFGDEDGSALYLEAQMDFENKEVWFYVGEEEGCERVGLAINVREATQLAFFLTNFIFAMDKNANL